MGWSMIKHVWVEQDGTLYAVGDIYRAPNRIPLMQAVRFVLVQGGTEPISTEAELDRDELGWKASVPGAAVAVDDEPVLAMAVATRIYKTETPDTYPHPIPEVITWPEMLRIVDYPPPPSDDT